MGGDLARRSLRVDSAGQTPSGSCGGEFDRAGPVGWTNDRFRGGCHASRFRTWGAKAPPSLGVGRPLPGSPISGLATELG